jgi:hypothetical protein
VGPLLKNGKRGRKGRKGKSEVPRTGRKSGTGATYNGGQAVGRAPSSQAAGSFQRKMAKGHMAATCSILNPFCPGAKGAKFPDGMGTNTIAFQSHGRLTMAGGITGLTTGNMTILAAGAPYGSLTATGYSAGFTFPTIWTQYSATSLMNGCGTYRIVSFGAIIRVASNVTNTSGILTLSTISPNQNYLGGGTVITNSNYEYVEQSSYPLAVGAEYCWIAKPVGVTANQFINQSSPSMGPNNEGSSYFNFLAIEISGSSNTCILDIEYFVNVEATVLAGNQLVHFIPKQVPKNPVAISKRDEVQAKIPSSSPGGASAFDRLVNDALDKAFSEMSKDPMGAIATGLEFLTFL